VLHVPLNWIFLTESPWRYYGEHEVWSSSLSHLLPSFVTLFLLAPSYLPLNSVLKHLQSMYKRDRSSLNTHIKTQEDLNYRSTYFSRSILDGNRKHCITVIWSNIKYWILQVLIVISINALHQQLTNCKNREMINSRIDQYRYWSRNDWTEMILIREVLRLRTRAA
jgi:hypothetical protein